MSWGMRSPNLSASGQSALTDGVAAPQGSSAVVSTERWKWKRRSWCPRDILSLREAGGGRLLKMPFPFYCSPVARRLAGLVLPSSLAAFSLLSLAAGTRASLPPSPQALLPREARGEGGGTVPCRTKPAVLALESAASAVPCATAASSLAEKCFLCVWQLHPCSLWLGESNGTGEPDCPPPAPRLQAPGLGWFWDTCVLKD